MTTFTTDDRLQCQIEIMQKISNDHYKELSDSLHRKPLTDEEIISLANSAPWHGTDLDIVAFARIIEERHGIK
jgi:hypothetical protein